VTVLQNGINTDAIKYNIHTKQPNNTDKGYQLSSYQYSFIQ